MTSEISIGQVKRDISDLVNRVAYQGERIILTSRGRPKAALIGLKDFEKLEQADKALKTRAAWLSDAKALSERIRQHRENQLIDVDALLAADRDDLESSNG